MTENNVIQRETGAVIGALIGLVRAADGNDLTNENTWQLLTDGTTLITKEPSDPSACQAMIERVHEEKHRLVPDCSTCTSPCGRTADADMGRVLSESSESRTLKMDILSGACSLVASKTPLSPDDRFLLARALFAVGEDCERDYLLSVLREVNASSSENSR